jgi:nitroimidazol reductase NimA-like FMN-containing flavoprotein (pyridoxamine 5'-phosphate oxidase superfamily)
MAYCSNEGCTTFYMITRTDSTKFVNLTKNPTVSLLIDTREREKGRGRVRALTVSGICSAAEDPAERKYALQLLSDRHPHLRSLWEDHRAAVLIVRAKSFLLLDGVSDAHYVELT